MTIYPLRYISILVPWHDMGWYDRVLNAPKLNISCLKLKRIAEKHAAAAEEALAGKRLDGLAGGAVVAGLRGRAHEVDGAVRIRSLG